ncbi:hypothetical protein B0T10DRAFT_415823 [Thelonectria olida]|uniref:Uncharacterized protein n=1 Tax=Thelonectria olida TaxID=1576542 RepID=A0A9P9AFN3_9HYPO|nr:hypothetical protein B0T10DRAFT_415823 [Thelonectria olida]
MSSNLMAKLYDALHETFGNDDNSLFQMEMPARLLEMGNYNYNGSGGVNAQQVKPPAVAEAEFRLADGMLNLSNLVGGPNGNKLSENYDEVLFGLAPANYISYIDIQTASEALQRAKESLRASVTRSIDDTEDIYPVVFTPNNWAKYLSTNFRPEDLLANADNTRAQLQDATKERSLLTLRRDALLAGRQDIKALERAATEASNALRASQAAMVRGYGENAINCIQMYFDVVAKKAQNKVAAIKGLTDSNKVELNTALQKSSEPPLSDDQWKSLIDMQSKCLQNQVSVSTASDALMDAQMAASQARGDDPTNQLEVMTERITSLTMDIDYYNKMLQASDNPPPETVPVAPPSQDGSGASVWQYFVIDSKSSKQTSTNLSNTSVAHSDWSVGLWFGSGSGQSDSATAGTSKKSTTENTDIQIGFRAMKVTIDRPWFNAQLLGQSNEFMHFNASKISAGNPQDIHKTLSSGGTVDGSNCLIPSWATAFIVAKDVHIIMTTHDTFSDSEVHDMKSSSSSGGGFLCFQASKSSSNSEHRDAFSMKNDNKNISIRITAPQVIGWISQLAPEDKSVSSYEPFNEAEFAKPQLVNGEAATT